MGAQEVVPAIAIHHFGCLAVNGYVYRLIAGKATAGSGIQLHDADVAEIGAVSAEETALGSHQEADIDGVAVFVSL